MGFPLTDHPSTDISRYFYIAAKFIDNAISSGGELFQNLNSNVKLMRISSVFCHFRKSSCSLPGWYTFPKRNEFLLIWNFFSCFFRWEYLDQQHAQLFIWWFIERWQLLMPFEPSACAGTYDQTMVFFNNWLTFAMSCEERGNTLTLAFIKLFISLFFRFHFWNVFFFSSFFCCWFFSSSFGYSCHFFFNSTVFFFYQNNFNFNCWIHIYR